MDSIGAYEARTHLPRLLDEVAQGHDFLITKRGAPIARLVAMGEERLRSRRKAVEALKGCQRTAPSLGGLSIRELINQGRDQCRSSSTPRRPCRGPLSRHESGFARSQGTSTESDQDIVM